MLWTGHVSQGDPIRSERRLVAMAMEQGTTLGDGLPCSGQQEAHVSGSLVGVKMCGRVPVETEQTTQDVRLERNERTAARRRTVR